MNIINAISDPNLFRNFLSENDDDLESWKNWKVALRALYGLAIRSKRSYAIVEECTGRNVGLLPEDGFRTALFLTGRRSGKSRTAAVIGAFEAALAGHESKLAAGERGVVAIMSPTKSQSTIVRNYLRAVFNTTPLLAQEVVRESREGFDLRNNISIQILAGDFRTVRGWTLVAAICDEVAFFGYDAESKVKSDTELIRAVQPGLATIGGKLVCISTPYARKGWCWDQFQKNHGNDDARVLVWNCPSRTMNPTLPQSVVDDALADDLASAKAEFLGEFRDDVAEYLPRSVIEAVVVQNRKELLPRPRLSYCGFADLSGGRSDDAALAIGHRNGRTVIIDLLRRYKAPFNPHRIVSEMANELKRYSLKQVTGDNYAADFVAQAFESSGISYQKAEKPKSILYAELLPRLCSKEIELLDDPLLINQLASLERRTRSGGRDIIDHPAGQHDDLANAVAGVAEVAATPVFTIGAF